MAAAKIAASIGTSAGRYGRKPGLGNACPIAIFTTYRKASGPALPRRRSAGSSARYNRASVSEKAYRVSSSRDLPCGHGLSIGILAVLDGDAHRGEFVADAIGLLEVLSRTRRRTIRNQAVDLLRIDAAR